MDKIEQLVKETPPVDNKSSRFGNPAFKTFYDKLSAVSSYFLVQTNYLALRHAKESTSWHESLPRLRPDAIPEIIVYFNEAWGNRTRVDYGSGMELNFLCWM